MLRNYILFFLVCVLIMSGWFLFLAPSSLPKKKGVDGKQVVESKDRQALPADDKKDTKKDESKKDETKKEEKKAPENKVEKKSEKEEPKKETKPQEPLKTETLGGDGFHLTALLTTRGAAAQKVILNRFQAANWLGRPVDHDLELIQEDPFAPSFRMYHYLDPKDEHPVFGLGETNWKLDKKEIKSEGGKVLFHEVTFSTAVPGMEQVTIHKTYRLAPKEYHMTMLLTLERDAKATEKEPTRFRYQLTGGQGLPLEGEWYASTFRNAYVGLVDPNGSLWRSVEDSTRISLHQGGERFPAAQRDNNNLQYAGTANQYFAVVILPDDKQPDRTDGGVDPSKILAWARPTLETKEVRGTIADITADEVLFREGREISHRYKLVPRTRQHLKDLELAKGDKAVLSFYETPDGIRVASWVRLGESLRPQFDDITMRVQSETVVLNPGDKVAHQFMLYHGPIKAALLEQFSGDKEVAPELVLRYTHTLHLRTLTDYHSDNWFGKISSKIFLTDLIIFFTRLMHWLLNLLHYVFGYGLSIVVLTLMVRGAMFPISRRQALFSIKMQSLAPELKKVQERYKDDPAGKMQATQEFYRKNGINPLGSCWPVFLQMPIFLGLYFALQESIHFRLANFLWIENLAAPDMLVRWGEGIPIISSPDHSAGFLAIFYLGPYLNVLPLCAAAMMLVQQIQTMPPPADEQQEMQQKMMRYMSLFFGIMFYKVAAGMCIYFITSSLWGVAERKLLPKKKTAPISAEMTAPTPFRSPSFGKGKGKPEQKEPIDENAWDSIKAWWKELLKQAEKK